MEAPMSIEEDPEPKRRERDLKNTKVVWLKVAKEDE